MYEFLSFWNVIIRDHAGGNKELIDGNTNDKLTVIGGDDRIDGLTVMIDKDGVDLHLGSLNIKCLRTPCHTTGHVCYYINAEQEGVVFTGSYYFIFGKFCIHFNTLINMK